MSQISPYVNGIAGVVMMSLYKANTEIAGFSDIRVCKVVTIGNVKVIVS